MLEFAADLDPELRSALAYRHARDAVFDARGVTIRCTPARRTACQRLADGSLVYRKHHERRAALREWRALHELRALGFRVPRALFVACAAGRSVVGLAAAQGRAMDVLLAEALHAGRSAIAARFAIECVAPLIARLHGAGLVFRDLYWNHLFAELDGEPVFIDVHRVLRPRWRRRRWIVKDLAGLLASLPRGYSRSACLRFLHRYAARRPPRALVRAIVAKARRIAAHRPKYG